MKGSRYGENKGQPQSMKTNNGSNVVGARVVVRGGEGPCGRPLSFDEHDHVPPYPTGDHKGPPRVTTSTLAPTFSNTRIISFIVVLLILTLFPHIAFAHIVSNTGRISGQLLDGTKKNAAVAGQSVTLQMAQGNSARDLTKVATDARGMFAFSNLNTDKSVSYAVYTLYQGAQYYTDLIDLSGKAVQQVNLTVYDATTSTKDIAIVQASVLLDKPDAKNGTLSVSESFFFENLGASTYVGSLAANGGRPNALRFALPPGARKLSLGAGFDGYQVIQVDPGFATDAAIPAGTSQFAFSFQVPYTASSYDFGYTAVYPTVDLSVLVPLDIHASSSGLTSEGPKNTKQGTYQLLDTRQLLAGNQIHVQLEGLPVPKTAATTAPANQNYLWLVVGLFIMLAIVAITWFLYRSNRRQVSRRAKRAPQRKTAAGKQGARSQPVKKKAEETVQSSDEQQALLQELLDLDAAYEAGTIKKAEYQERRAKTRARLRALVSAEVEQKAARGK